MMETPRRTKEQRADLARRRADYITQQSAILVARYMAAGWDRDDAEAAARRTFSAAFVRSIVRV